MKLGIVNMLTLSIVEVDSSALETAILLGDLARLLMGASKRGEVASTRTILNTSDKLVIYWSRNRTKLPSLWRFLILVPLGASQP